MSASLTALSRGCFSGLLLFHSLHLQLHGGSSHLRLPGRPLQQKGHPELRHHLLVGCDSVQLLHRQRGTTPLRPGRTPASLCGHSLFMFLSCLAASPPPNESLSFSIHTASWQINAAVSAPFSHLDLIAAKAPES